MIRNCLLLALLSGTLLAGCSHALPPPQSPPDNRLATARMHAHLGMTWLGLHETARAKQTLRRALKEAPELPETWYAMAWFLEKTGHRRLAEKYWQHALRMAPHRGDVHNSYGTFLCHNGKYRQAISHFRQAAKDPAWMASADALENAGLCALKIPDPQLANAFFRKALGRGRNQGTAV